jgi:hypothetical protein
MAFAAEIGEFRQIELIAMMRVPKRLCVLVTIGCRAVMRFAREA